MSRAGVSNRFVIVAKEQPTETLPPIELDEGTDLVSIDEALKSIVADVRTNPMICEAKRKARQSSDGLTLNESMSIYLYTMGSLEENNYFYKLLNEKLRTKQREDLKPWLSYLKNFLTGLHKLPSIQTKVWCGFHGNIDDFNKENIILWGFTSCTTMRESIEPRLDQSDERILLSIECINGKDIKSFSKYDDENEVLLVPGTCLTLQGVSRQADGLYTIHLQETNSPHQLFKPPFNLSPSTIDVRAHNIREDFKSIFSKSPDVPVSSPVDNLDTVHTDLGSPTTHNDVVNGRTISASKNMKPDESIPKDRKDDQVTPSNDSNSNQMPEDTEEDKKKPVANRKRTPSPHTPLTDEVKTTNNSSSNQIKKARATSGKNTPPPSKPSGTPVTEATSSGKNTPPRNKPSGTPVTEATETGERKTSARRNNAELAASNAANQAPTSSETEDTKRKNDLGSNESSDNDDSSECSSHEDNSTWFDVQFHDNKQTKVKKPDELQNAMNVPDVSINREILNRIRGSMTGMALGDALGAHVEFRPHQFLVNNPVKDLESGGTWGLTKGQFTDDTSMALCLANSLVACHGFNPYDQLVRYKWWYKFGYMSSTGDCFDIGAATSNSLRAFARRQNAFANEFSIPLTEMDRLPNSELRQKFNVYCSEDGVAGNGALMRLAPVPLFFYRNPPLAVEYSGISGQITHGDRKAYDACRYYGALIVAALQGYKKEQILDNNFYGKHKEWFGKEKLHPDIESISRGSYKKDGYDAGIRGKGYIVNALEAALWAFWSDKNSFETGALAAVNLGDDTDTTAAIYGQLAGAHYGYQKLPEKWLQFAYAKTFMHKLSKWIAYEGECWKKSYENTAS
ncbi:unnamed protein product [Rotaria socialis]|uniref:NAD(P)(+)--arginine ADP-ribosyltransferase n=1 Tax=Rotaria socialis TaxID=392032 RepID=A0A818QX03_9BILA|nr:unnamed protein product [Rotaria socialis]